MKPLTRQFMEIKKKGVLTAAGSTPFTPPASGLLAYWPLVEDTNDTSGGGYNLSATGAAISGDPASLVFDGINDCATNAAFPFGSTKIHTFTSWLKIATYTGTRMILEASANANLNNGTFALYTVGSEMRGLIHDGATAKTRVESITPPPAEQWAHLIVEFDNRTISGDINFWVNNSPVSTLIDLNVKTASSEIGTQPIFFGGRNCSSLFCAMSMRGALIYNRSLSESERTQIYEGTAFS